MATYWHQLCIMSPASQSDYIFGYIVVTYETDYKALIDLETGSLNPLDLPLADNTVIRYKLNSTRINGKGRLVDDDDMTLVMEAAHITPRSLSTDSCKLNSSSIERPIL